MYFLLHNVKMFKELLSELLSYDVKCYNCDVYILMKLQKSYDLGEYHPYTDLQKKEEKKIHDFKMYY